MGEGGPVYMEKDINCVIIHGCNMHTCHSSTFGYCDGGGVSPSQ